MTTVDEPLPPLAPGPAAPHGPVGRSTEPQPPSPWAGPPPSPWAAGQQAAQAHRPSAPSLFPVLGWCGFGLAFGSVVTAVAGAALALCVVGIVQARAAGRLLAPPVVGAAIAALALAVHLLLFVLGFTGGLPFLAGGAPPAPAWTVAEQDYLDALADDAEDVYLAEYDEDLVVDGHTACDALAGGASAAEAADALTWDRPAEARAIVAVATDTLCDPSGGSLDQD